MKMVEKLTNHGILNFLKPSICSEPGNRFSVSWHETRIRQLRATKTHVGCQHKKENKSKSNPLTKTISNNDFYTHIQFNSYMREVGTKQDKNMLTTGSPATHHTILQKPWS